jgi:hypothetical protein
MAAERDISSTKRNHRSFYRHQQGILRTLNDLYIEAKIVSSALRDVRDLKWPRESAIKVPSTGTNSSTIRRSDSEVKTIISRERERRTYEKSIVLIVSVVEDYLLSYARLVLRAHPRLINKSLQGNEGRITVEFNELITSGMDGIIEARVNERLHSASYASPSSMANYLAAIFGKPVRNDAFSKYVEMKASRDLIVHAKSIINSTYLQKTAERARGSLGEELPVDEAYYKDGLRTAKQICVSVYKIMVTQFGDDEAVAAVVARIGI